MAIGGIESQYIRQCNDSIIVRNKWRLKMKNKRKGAKRKAQNQWRRNLFIRSVKIGENNHRLSKASNVES